MITEHDRHGDREAVIDLHFVYDGNVEFIEDQRLRNMAGQFLMVFDTGTGLGPQPSSAG